MAGTGHGDEARKTADGAGDGHGADSDLLHVDAGIPGGVLGVAHHGDLIALFGVLQIQEHADGQRQYDDDVQCVSLAEQSREPAALGLLVDLAHSVGAEGVFPEGHAVAGQLDGHIVHHQGEQRLIGVPLCLEGGGDDAPDAAAQQAGGCHDHQQDRSGDGVAIGPHETGGHDAADEHLALGADVPELHLEGGGQAHADAQQSHGVADGDPTAAGGPESAVEHGLIDLNRIQLGDGENEDTADHQGQNHSHDADGVGLGTGDAVPFGNSQQRFFMLFHRTHPSAASFLKRVISRPTSSLVVVRASTMPLTWPPHRTRIRSHNSSRTSRSSPT